MAELATIECGAERRRTLTARSKIIMKSLRFQAIVGGFALGLCAVLLFAGCEEAKKAGAKTGSTAEKEKEASAAPAPKADETVTQSAAAETTATENVAAEQPAAQATEVALAPAAKADKPVAKPAGEQAAASDPTAGGRWWNQWAGSSVRNNTPVGKNIPTEFEPGEFDAKTGEWKPGSGKNVKWCQQARLAKLWQSRRR